MDMLHLLRKPTGTLCDGLSRRDWLIVGGLGLAGLSLPGLLRAEDRRRRGGLSAHSGTAKSCIMIFLAGGPSHHDMWDMKPAAPPEIRGEFKPIPTTVPGIQLCEHLPRLAGQARHIALIRSAHHRVSNAHAAAVYTALTGEDRGDATIAVTTSPRDNPAIGSVLTYLRPPQKAIVPFVSLPFITAEGAGGPPQPGIYGGWLGRKFDPLQILKDPNAPDFGVPEMRLLAEVSPERLGGRHGLLADLNRQLDEAAGGEGRVLDEYQQRAFTLLSSDDCRRAFDIGSEDPRLRDAYGRNIYGQSTLLARRLVEAGTRMVCVKWAPDANATWDTHGGNFTKLKNELLPQLDMALATLLEDLRLRGRLDETLVVCMGEFGRTPKVNASAGRDHWPYCYSLLLAGGGVKGGFVFGQSDRIGATPAEQPVTPQDIVATIYALLGIPPDLELPDQLGRPLRLLPDARVLQDLLA
jgi:hypothetical protein